MLDFLVQHLIFNVAIGSTSIVEGSASDGVCVFKFCIDLLIELIDAGDKLLKRFPNFCLKLSTSIRRWQFVACSSFEERSSIKLFLNGKELFV